MSVPELGRTRHPWRIAGLIAAALLAGAAGSSPASRPTLTDACLNALGERAGEICILDIKTGALLAHVETGNLSGAYPPGSVAKLVTAHAALLRGAVNPRTTFVCHNAIRIAGRVYHCTRPGGHGRLTLPEAISSSCNIWFYQASMRLGASDLQKSWAAFGIPVSRNSLTPVFRASVGESGFTVTPLDLARLARTIALKSDSPDSPCRLLASAMREVVAHGTATALRSAGISCAGKSGSPSQPGRPDRRHGWFIGFAPATRPRIAFAVFCLEGNAYRSAVPVTRKLLESYALQSNHN